MTALFKTKRVDTPKSDSSKKETKAVVVVKEGNQPSRSIDSSMILIRPHITEKATDISGRGVYVFDINKLANKAEVRTAILRLYKVKPTKITIVNRRPKFAKNPRTGRLQVKQQGGKKALVYLKSGDKIESV